MSEVIECDIKNNSEIRSLIGKRITSSQLWFLTVENCDYEQQARYFLKLEKKVFTEEQQAKMDIGIKYESDVRNYYSEMIGMPIKETGFFISKKYSLIGGISDGMLPNGDIIEIKITENSIPTTFNDNHDEIYKCYVYQMMMNCFLTGAKNCHYVMYSRTDQKLYTKIIKYDESLFFNNVLNPIIDFYKKYMIPLMNKHKIMPYSVSYKLIEYKLNNEIKNKLK